MIPNKAEHSIPVVYLIRCLVNGKIYVGSAKNFYIRYGTYKRGHKRDKRHLTWAMAKHGFDQFEFSILEVVEIKDLISREQYYIDLLRATDKEIGYNVCPTAGSSLGRIPSATTRAKISAKNMGKGRSVLQIDRQTGKVIAEYGSAPLAASSIGVGTTAIANVCKGKRVSTGGYAWCYKDQYNPNTYRVRQPKSYRGTNGQPAKPIAQLDLAGNQIKVWESAIVAGKELGWGPHSIRAACYGRVKTAHGYRWEFITDPKIIEEANSQRKQRWEEIYATRDSLRV